MPCTSPDLNSINNRELDFPVSIQFVFKISAFCCVLFSRSWCALHLIKTFAISSSIFIHKIMVPLIIHPHFCFLFCVSVCKIMVNQSNGLQNTIF